MSGGDVTAREARLKEIAELVETHWPWGLREDGRWLLAELEAAEARTAQLAEALGPFLAHPRYLSIGSYNNTVEVRLSAKSFEDARAALSLLDDTGQDT